MGFHILQRQIINGQQMLGTPNSLVVGTFPSVVYDLIWGVGDANEGEDVKWGVGDANEGQKVTTTDPGV